MFWKVEYSHYIVEAETATGKDNILKKTLKTLQRFPYLSANLYKFRGDEKIFVDTYEFDVKGWNAGKPAALKKVI